MAEIIETFLKEVLFEMGLHLGRFFKIGCMKEEMFFRHKDGICKSTELREYVVCTQGREQSL